MKPKQVLILALLCVALIIGIILKQSHKVPELSTQEYAPLDLSFDSVKAAKLEILNGKNEKLVELAKIDSGWQVVNFNHARSDQQKIDQLFNSIRSTKGELRAKDKALFSDFGISDEQAYSVVVSDSAGAVLLNVKLGTKRPGSAVFLRQTNSDVVYYVATDLFSQIGLNDDPAKTPPKSDYWVSVSIVNFQTDDVKHLEATRFENGQAIKTAQVSRQTDPNDLSKKTWQFERKDLPFPLDSEKIKTFLNSIKMFPALKPLDPKAQNYGFDKPVWSLKLVLEDGKEIILTAGSVNAENQARYVSVSTEPVAFELADYYFKTLDIDDSKFFVNNPLGIEPEKTTKLGLQAGPKKADIDVNGKPSDVVKSYLSNLQTISVGRLLWNEKEAKKLNGANVQTLTLQKDSGQAQTLKVGEIVSEQPKEYAARLSSGTAPFTISQAVFEAIFQNEGIFNSNEHAKN